jgi:predicted Zn-dependent protease
VGKVTYRATITLPEGYSVDVPSGANVRSDFADYLASYSLIDGVLTVQRTLVRKQPTIPIAQWTQYQRFAKAVAADEFRFIQLVGALNTPVNTTRTREETGPTVISEPKKAPEPQRATVILESTSMYSKMSSTSPVMEVLHKGDQVTINYSIDGPGGGWCSATHAQTGKTGNIACSALLQEPLVQEARSAPAPPRPPTAALSLPTDRASRIPQAPPNTQIYFVPIGSLSEVKMDYLAGYYKQRFGLTVQVLSAIPLDPAAFNTARQQNQIEGLMASMKRAYPTLANDGRSIVIGITEADIYTTTEKWIFALAWRDEGHLAVISAARMDLEHTNYRLPTDPVVLHNRLTKMISREIGFLYYKLPFSRDERSVVRTSVMGVDELDELGEDF